MSVEVDQEMVAEYQRVAGIIEDKVTSLRNGEQLFVGIAGPPGEMFRIIV